MAGKYNNWLREKLARRIESNGGYGAYPLEWIVHFYESIYSFDEAKELLVEHQHFTCLTDLNLQYPDFDDWWEGNDPTGPLADRETPSSAELYAWAQDRLCEDLHEDDGMRMWSPETAAKYGFDYKGDGAERPFACKLESHGGGGKHVVLTEFEGVELYPLQSEELAEAVRRERDDLMVSNKWCRQLMGMMDEWDAMLTDDAAESSGTYYMVDEIAQFMGLFD